MPEQVRKRFAAAAAMLHEEDDSTLPDPQKQGSGGPGEQSYVSDEHAVFTDEVIRSERGEGLEGGGEEVRGGGLGGGGATGADAEDERMM